MDTTEKLCLIGFVLLFIMVDVVIAIVISLGIGVVALALGFQFPFWPCVILIAGAIPAYIYFFSGRTSGGCF